MIRTWNIKIKDHDIFVNEAGKEKDCMLILLHGGGSFYKRSEKLLMKMILKISDHFHVLAPEHPGFYRSKLNAYWNIQDYNEYIEEFINTIAQKEYVLMGQSFGSRLAIEFACKNQNNIKLLVLGNPATFFDEKRFDLAYISGYLLENVKNKNFKKVLAEMALAKNNIDIDDADRYFNVVKLLRSPLTTRIKSNIKSIRTKTLIFWGNLDPMISKKQALILKRQLRNSSLINLNMSHPAMLIENKKVIKKIIEEMQMIEAN